MDPLLKLLHENAALKPAQLAAMLNTTESEVVSKIKAYEASEVILGYRTVLNEEKLNREIVRVLNSADVKDRFSSSGLEAVGGSPEQFAAKIKSEMTRMGKVIKDAGIKEE